MAVYLTIEIQERGSTRTVVVNEADVNWVGLVFSSENTDLSLNFTGMEPILIPFPSSSHRDTFVTDLKAGIEGAASFTLSNGGPVATTTTTTAPTTTTTTVP